MNEHEHQELRVSLDAYILGQLPADETEILETHLDTCTACTTELAKLNPIATALRPLRDEPTPDTSPRPPPDLKNRVVRTVTTTATAKARRSQLRVASLITATTILKIVATLRIQTLPKNDNAATVVPLETVQIQAERGRIQASADLVNHT